MSGPTQTQRTVSNDAFEALIDLLASDGIDEKPSTPSEDRVRSQPNMTLRDPSGKLDFDKIRLMFAAQNECHRVSFAPDPPGEQKIRVQSPTVPIEDGDSDDEACSQRSTSSTAPSLSTSPESLGRAAIGHRRSSTFGNQPGAAFPESATAAKVDVAPALLYQPLSFDELNTALAGAHEEVRTLRHQHDELQAVVSKRLGAETRDQVKKTPSAVKTDKDNGHVETRDAASQAPGCAIVPPAPLPSDVPTEIATLSENEAKRALSALARALNLSPSTIGSMTSPVAPMPSPLALSPPNLTRQHDVASISRAVKFLGTVDELVWRRASGPSGPRTLLPVFSEENIIALVARLELWERAVRRSPKA